MVLNIHVCMASTVFHAVSWIPCWATSLTFWVHTIATTHASFSNHSVNDDGL